jgi:hypothetical protein
MTTPPFKEIIWTETQGSCVYCGEVIEEDCRSVDHVVPQCRGGTGSLDNLVPACVPCNNRRGLVYPPHVLAHERWVEYVKAKENAAYDYAAAKAERMLRRPTNKRVAMEAVMVFFNGGAVTSGPEGIKVKVNDEVVAFLSWTDIAKQFYRNFDFS